MTELIPVRPVVHYMMGGVHTDIDGATPLAGLYAAGETACVSINGANRLGSNSLPECLVFGARAGRAAAEYAASARRAAGRRSPPRSPTRYAGSSGPAGHACRGPDAVSAIRDRDAGRRWRSAAGIYRTGPAMAKGADTLQRACRSGWRRSASATPAAPSTPSSSPPSSSPTCSTSPSACSQSGLRREESRGAHQRTDFPDRDDERFLAHQLVHRDADGAPRVEQLPVTITRWPPGERVYGR